MKLNLEAIERLSGRCEEMVQALDKTKAVGWTVEHDRETKARMQGIEWVQSQVDQLAAEIRLVNEVDDND